MYTCSRAQPRGWFGQNNCPRGWNFALTNKLVDSHPACPRKFGLPRFFLIWKSVVAECCWCESFCHQTALKSLTRSEKTTIFFQNPNLISIWHVSMKTYVQFLCKNDLFHYVSARRVGYILFLPWSSVHLSVCLSQNHFHSKTPKPFEIFSGNFTQM